MKIFVSLCVMFLLAAGLCLAADINGKWVAEQKFTPPNGGDEMVITTTFDLKSSGGAITGTVTTARAGGEPRSSEIKEGKLEGDNFTFKVTTETQRGTSTWLYSGTVAGSELKGKREREGGQGGGGGGRMGSGEFVAKKQ